MRCGQVLVEIIIQFSHNQVAQFCVYQVILPSENVYQVKQVELCNFDQVIQPGINVYQVKYPYFRACEIIRFRSSESCPLLRATE